MTSERFQRRIDRLLDQIEEGADQHAWATVRQLAQDILVLDPGNTDANNFLAAAERALGGSGPSPTGQPTALTQSATPPATLDQPTSFANGRYQIQKFLGEGGKKKVYLAHDTLLDRDVAFGLIKTEGLDDTSRLRIQREAQAMGRLGSHPNIVTVFDLGQHDGQPYMVTELMGGGDVEGLVEKSSDHGLDLEQAFKIVVEVCSGLEFAHGRGIVHRDLKPGNVWLTAEGTAKIGDFGLAVVLDRSRLTTEGMMVGTVSYMPPEQAMGGEVTPKSDLYSLGAMLYEMVTGRPPFLGDDSVAIIGQHINTPPVAPTWHNGQCPRALDALILRLLAKDPAQRPESATDVLSALNAIDVATSVEQPVTAVDEAHALDSLAGGVFVGRQREMDDLKAALEDALSGRGRLVTLVGEPGIGKTRTAQELVTYAGLRGAQVLWGRCYEGEGAPPYWPWVQAIRSYVRNRDPEQLRSDMGAGAADIAEVVSDVKEQLPGLNLPAQLEPEQARFRLFDSITAFLRSAGQRQPMVLVLEDLHWADKPSLLLLEFLAGDLSNARLLIIGTYRDVELSRGHPLSTTLGQLNRERSFQRVLLRGLDQEDVGRFIELAAGMIPPSGMVETVHQQTEGNPLFVTEVVRLLVQEGELTKGKISEQESWSVRIPEGVREVIGRRLARLSERCNNALTIASVIGREFTLEQIKPVAEDMTEDRLLAVLDEALAAKVIQELPGTVGQYQFTHALIQETLAEELSTTRKVRVHARIAQALEDLYGDNTEAHATELVRHYAEAVSVLGPAKLVRYSLLSGEQAIANYAYEEALVHFKRALAAKQGEPPSTGSGQGMDVETGSLLFGLGRAQAATLPRHQNQEVLDSLSRAFDCYAEAGDVARAVTVAEFPFYLPVGHHMGVARLIDRALKLVSPDSQEAGRLLSRYGMVMGMEEADYDRAQEAFGRSLTIAEGLGDAALEMRTLAWAARVDRFHLHYQECLEKSQRAIELARRADASFAEAVAHRWAARALEITGDDPEGACRHAAAVLDLAERLRDRARLTSALDINANLYRLLGDWQSARDFSSRGLEVAPWHPQLLGGRVLLEYELGDFDQGDAFLETLLEAMRRTPDEPTTENSVPGGVIPVVARITGDSGRFNFADKAIETILSSPSATPAAVMWARASQALLAVVKSDAATAEEQYAVLEPQGGKMLSTGVSMAVDRLLGLLSVTRGRLDEAMAHFEAALGFCRRAGYRPELAWTCCDYADALLQRKGEDDRPKAMALLDESLAVAHELGMRPLIERGLSRREILRA